MSKNVYITPAMTDEGAAQGALIANLVEKKVDIEWLKQMVMPYFGTSYSKEDVIKKIKEFNIGHFLVGESMFIGLPRTIKKFKEIIK